MNYDAHVHMGYFLRAGYAEPFYYSPQRVFGVLNRCGIENFIVSSTCAQVEEIGIRALVREAREMKRIAGERAHVFFWLTGRLYDEDPEMKWLDTGLFEGIKIHEGETPWMKRRRGDLVRVVSLAADKCLPVVFHAGLDEGCHPSELAEIAQEFPSVHFNFAHCCPMDEMAKVIAGCPNVWTDTAYMRIEDFPKLRGYNWCGRLMFGTDLPVWQACENVSLTIRYREYVRASLIAGMGEMVESSFGSFARGYGYSEAVISGNCRWFLSGSPV